MSKDVLMKLKSQKTPRKKRKKLILQLIGQGVIMADIARQLGLSRQRIHQLARGYKSN